MSWHRKYRELIIIAGMVVALILGVLATALSLNANAATAHEANQRAAAAQAAQLHEQTTFCGWFQYVASLPLPPSSSDLGKGISAKSAAVTSPTGLNCVPSPPTLINK